MFQALRCLLLCLVFAASSSVWSGEIPLALSESYGAFSVKWVTDATAQNSVQRAAQRNAGRAQQKLLKALQKFAKKPDPAKLEKYKSQVTTLLAKGSGQTSAFVWGGVLQTLNFTPAIGLSGSAGIGDPASGGVSHSFTLSQQYKTTYQGEAFTIYYSAPPTTADLPFSFHALLVSDNLSQLPGSGFAGIWMSTIVDPALIPALAQYGISNVTTSSSGVAVTLTPVLSFATEPVHSGTATLSDTYFSIQDLFGVGVPPEVVEAASQTFAKLLEKIQKAK
ncbi:MAG TPA: hypothetical protein VEK08_12415 [Planctomycetota bacterium]|nr:hypothetical protein [Planctomycetota bacterium]